MRAMDEGRLPCQAGPPSWRRGGIDDSLDRLRRLLTTARRTTPTTVRPTRDGSAGRAGTASRLLDVGVTW